MIIFVGWSGAKNPQETHHIRFHISNVYTHVVQQKRQNNIRSKGLLCYLSIYLSICRVSGPPFDYCYNLITYNNYLYL